MAKTKSVAQHERVHLPSWATGSTQTRALHSLCKNPCWSELLRISLDTERGRYFAIAAGAGVDLMLGNDLKIRLIDVEYQQLPQFTFGTISPYGISFGVSYRVFNGSR